jgi:hypothetical protein
MICPYCKNDDDSLIEKVEIINIAQVHVVAKYICLCCSKLFLEGNNENNNRSSPQSENRT